MGARITVQSCGCATFDKIKVMIKPVSGKSH